MLCPEVWNFPVPKVITSQKVYEKLESVTLATKSNNYYKSLVVTCPDELQAGFIEDVLTEDTDYYKLTDCSISEFLEPTFIDNFVKKGNLNCITTHENCIVENCAAITPDGILTIHVLEYIFQTLGLEGTKRPHNYYEVNLDLKTSRNPEKTKRSLHKLENFDFNISWVPEQEDVCPSSIAKYFYERKVKVSLHSLELKKLSPTITEIPSVKDVECDDVIEWIGMLAIGGNLNPTQDYISTYSQPESDHSLKSNRICLVIAKGFITYNIIQKLCEKLSQYVLSRELNNYWASISIQSEDSLWQWCPSSPRMFQSFDCSLTIFFTHDRFIVHSIGQLKYS